MYACNMYVCKGSATDFGFGGTVCSSPIAPMSPLNLGYPKSNFSSVLDDLFFVIALTR